MRAILQSHPPLGQVTRVGDEALQLIVVLQAPAHPRPVAWQVASWHSVDKAEWTETLLSRVPAEKTPRCLQDDPEAKDNVFFAAPLSFKSHVQFTLKFRVGESEEWRWIRDDHGLEDGHVVRKAADYTGDSVADLIPSLSGEWRVAELLSQSSRSRLWSLEAAVPAAQVDESGSKDVEIGFPWGTFMRWFALVRLAPPWLAPCHGRAEFFLDKDALLCSFLGENGRNLVFLAMSGVGDVVSVFRRGRNGSLSAHMMNDGASEGKGTILVSESDDFDSAVAAVMHGARSVMEQTSPQSRVASQEVEALSDGVKPQWRESWYDGLGYCTWNALGQNLSEKKVLDAMDKLASQGVKFSSLIIDDNWQSLDYRGEHQDRYGWVDFEAEPKMFPNGLKALVSQIREEYPDIQHIAVWHALLGYWGGIAPNGSIAQAYKTIEVIRKDGEGDAGRKMTVVAKEDVPRLYDDFYHFLSGAGIDAVKTDAQCIMDLWAEASARRDLTKTYLDAWATASLRYFGIKCISCMSQFPQALFYSQMSFNRPAIPVRNSDDFFPVTPSSHPWHVWVNAHNSILTKHLNVLPDWDMFQTVHDYSGFHAAGRCISGGPIYITDVPGEHNMDLIGQMTGVTPRGNTVIFRPSVVGKSVDSYTGYHDNCLLKVGGYNGAGETGTAILGVFNVSTRLLVELVPLSCFPGTLAGREYVVRAHTTGKTSPPSRIDGPCSLLTTMLGVRSWEIFSAFPLQAFNGAKHGKVLVSNLGLLRKMTGCAAVVSNSISDMGNGRIMIDAHLKALGVVGVYLSTLPDMTVEGDFMVTMQGQPIPSRTVTMSVEDRHVLEVDLETAWKEMKLDGGWSNEVEVKVYFDS